MSERHGADCAYRKPNKLGTIGNGKGSGTTMPVSQMAGRKVTVGSMSRVNPLKIKGSSR